MLSHFYQIQMWFSVWHMSPTSEDFLDSLACLTFKATLPTLAQHCCFGVLGQSARTVTVIAAGLYGRLPALRAAHLWLLHARSFGHLDPGLT